MLSVGTRAAKILEEGAWLQQAAGVSEHGVKCSHECELKVTSAPYLYNGQQSSSPGPAKM